MPFIVAIAGPLVAEIAFRLLTAEVGVLSAHVLGDAVDAGVAVTAGVVLLTISIHVDTSATGRCNRVDVSRSLWPPPEGAIAWPPPCRAVLPRTGGRWRLRRRG